MEMEIANIINTMPDKRQDRLIELFTAQVKQRKFESINSIINDVIVEHAKEMMKTKSPVDIILDILEGRLDDDEGKTPEEETVRKTEEKHEAVGDKELIGLLQDLKELVDIMRLLK